MQTTLHVDSHILLANGFEFVRPDIETGSQFAQRVMLSSKSPICYYTIALSRRIGNQPVVISARRKRRTSGSEKLTKFAVKIAALLVHYIKVLPHPLDLLVSEMCGGNGGGGRFFRKGLGGLGGFGGWRRIGKGMIGFWEVLAFCGLCFLYGKEMNANKHLLVLGISLTGVSLIKTMKVKVKNWLLWLSCFGCLLSIGLKREHFVKWVKETRVSSSNITSKGRGKGNCRRGF